MATIVTRAGKGSPLTNTEVDANFTNLNTDKIELTDISASNAASSGVGSLAYSNISGTFTYTPPDLSSFLTGNQTITLSGDASGSGTTSINVTVANNSHNHLWSNITSTPSTLAGYGISDAYTKTDVDSLTWDASDITSGTFVSARISQASVVQHQEALTITESQISDFGTYNNYIHPTNVTTNINTSGAVIVDAISTTSEGHISAMSTRTLTLADLGYTGATDANNYSHPTNVTTNINTSGATIVDNISTTSEGHISAMGTRVLTLSDLGYTGATDAIALDDISVTTVAASSGGSLTYNDLTGVFTFAPADLSSVTTTLAGLTDTNITNPQEGDIMVYTSGEWVNTPNTGGGTQVFVQTLEPVSWNVGDAWIKIPA